MESSPFQTLDAGDCHYHANGRFVGVFVKGERELDHVGLLYAFESKSDAGVKAETRELHFVTNEKIIHQKLKTTRRYLHAPLGLDEYNAIAFAAYLTVVANKYETKPPILYGMDWLGAKDSFDDEGNYLKPWDTSGLTCATFVCELLRGCDWDPVDDRTWPRDHPDDLHWREEKIAEYVARQREERTAITPAQIDDMKAVSPFVRLRPEQIAGAASSSQAEWPTDYEKTAYLAEQVLALFRSFIPGN